MLAIPARVQGVGISRGLNVGYIIVVVLCRQSTVSFVCSVMLTALSVPNVVVLKSKIKNKPKKPVGKNIF
jgi:branched-subunit amino acid transport protein